MDKALEVHDSEFPNTLLPIATPPRQQPFLVATTETSTPPTYQYMQGSNFPASPKRRLFDCVPDDGDPDVGDRHCDGRSASN